MNLLVLWHVSIGKVQLPIQSCFVAKFLWIYKFISENVDLRAGYYTDFCDTGGPNAATRLRIFLILLFFPIMTASLFTIYIYGVAGKSRKSHNE